MRMKNELLSVFTILFCVLPTFASVGHGQSASDLETLKRQGEQLLEKGEPERALEHYQNALDNHPGEGDLLFGAGKAAWFSGDVSGAVDHLYAAIQALPDHYESNFLLGQALLVQGREMAADPMTENDGYMMIGDALNFMRRASDLDPKSAEAAMLLATTLYELYDFEAADEAAAIVLERRPGDLDALLMRGDLAFTSYTQGSGEELEADVLKERWQKAVDFYKKVINRDQKQIRAHLGLGGLYEWEKVWADAAGAYLQALHIDPELSQAYERLLIIHNRDDFDAKLSGELQGLIKEIDKNFPDEPSRKATASYYLGRALMQEGSYKKSIEAFEQSIALNEQFRTCVSYYICRAAYGAEDTERAANVLVETMRNDPQGLAYFMQNDYEFTTQVYIPMKFIAFHLVQGGRFEEARDLNGILINLVTNDHTLFNDYGLLCRDTGQYEEAFVAYEKAVELDPQNPSYLNDCALILHYHLHRDLDRAEDMYNHAIEVANKLLENPDELDEARTEVVQIALRDATNNLALLKRGVTEPEN